MRLIILIFIISVFSQSCILYKRGRSEEGAKAHVEECVGKIDTTNYIGELISKRKVLKMAKDSVYSRYGFLNIYINEKPFKKYYINKYLYLGGTMRCRRGGVFWIVIDRTNGKVVSFAHGK